jgi:formate hydrogenlyase subunit 3/multisubunit Na+/H+ antiporter MnhD subunit
MSGVMTKVAVYGFVRIVFDLLGPPAWWWATPVLAIGATTAVIGVLHAMMQQQLKTLLAYSTVENIGIIFIGLGLTLAFQANHMDAAAAVAFTASLLHVLNHAFFKSLLFFGAGAVLSATGERDMDRLGGLIHRMPWTAALFLVGAAAISALPPLNGFVSEWLILQAIFLSPELPQWGLRLLVPTTGAMLALSTALAAACFVRAYGVSFLGRARGAAALTARETDPYSVLSMIVLAACCVLIGILPAPLVDLLAPATQQIIHTRMPEQSVLAWRSLVPIAESRSSYNGLLVFTFIALAGCLAALLIHRLGSRALRRAPAWDCGTPITSPRTQYTAASIAQPIRRVFGEVVFDARERVSMPPPGDLGPARFQVEMRDPSWAFIYTPLVQGIGFAAQRLNGLQFLTIRRYLTFVFLALVTLLLVLAIWS